MSNPTVFISYSHIDVEWKNRLVKHLGVLEHEGLLDVWDDTRISGGDAWYLDIQEAISRAHVAVLLVSANFLTSDFILKEEVPRLLRRRKEEGLHVFPVIAKPSVWKNVGWLAEMQVRPRGGAPLSEGTEHDGDRKLAEIAAEIAGIIRLASEPTKGRQEALTDLAGQLQQLFETFNCDYREHGARLGKQHDWIVSIPGSAGNERVLVRAVAGEVGQHQAARLHTEVQRLRTRRGWLVSTRRPSEGVRGRLTADGHGNIHCYTVDDVQEELASFEGYFRWLEAQVAKRQIGNLYLDLACTRREMDVKAGEIAASDRYPSIEEYVNRWLNDPAPDQLSVLGDFGTGKTWFALRCAWRQLQAYREAQKGGAKRPRIPLYIPLRYYAEGGGMESLYSDIVFPEHGITRLSYQAFEKLNQMGRFLIIYDGFDEMSAGAERERLPEEARANFREQTREQVRRNFRELAQTAGPGSKVLLTSRTEHFPDPEEAHLVFSV